MSSIIAVNPFKCRVWHLHYRLEEHIDEASCKLEIKSFTEHGQLLPVLGRRLRRGGEHEVELICGARRLFVARHINCPLIVELRDFSDRDAIIAMDLENSQRRDISPYERGLSYARWLQIGHFESQDDIAHALGVSSSQVSRLLKVARLPIPIVKAFPREIDIREAWGLQLAEVIEDAESWRRVREAAELIASITPKPAPEDVYQQLLHAAHRRIEPAASSPNTVSGIDGRLLFRIHRRRDATTIELPAELVSAQCLENIKVSIAAILEEGSGLGIQDDTDDGELHPANA